MKTDIFWVGHAVTDFTNVGPCSLQMRAPWLFAVASIKVVFFSTAVENEKKALRTNTARWL